MDAINRLLPNCPYDSDIVMRAVAYSLSYGPLESRPMTDDELIVALHDNLTELGASSGSSNFPEYCHQRTHDGGIIRIGTMHPCSNKDGYKIAGATLLKLLRLLYGIPCPPPEGQMSLL